MDERKKKIVVVAVILTVLIGMAGMLAIPPKKISESEQSRVINELNTMVAEQEKPHKVMELLDRYVAKMSKEKASEGINAYLYSLYQVNSDMTGKLSYLGYDLVAFIEEYDLDITNELNTFRLEEGLMKGFILEVEKNHLRFKYDGANYYVTVDTQYLLDKYGEYMTEDFKSYMSFREMEENSIIYNGNTNKVDIEEVAKRLDRIEKERASWEKTIYSDKWMDSSKYYHQILLGINHTYFLKDETSQVVKDEFIDEYRGVASKYPDSEFTGILKTYIEMLEKSNGEITSEIDDYRNKAVEEKFPSTTEILSESLDDEPTNP